MKVSFSCAAFGESGMKNLHRLNHSSQLLSLRLSRGFVGKNVRSRGLEV